MQSKSQNEVPLVPVQFATFEGKAVNTIPFKPGMLVRQGKKVYQVDEKGTWRRLRTE
jgi:hypothetical protein